MASADTTLVRLIKSQIAAADSAFTALCALPAIRSSHNDSVQHALDSFLTANPQFSLVVRGDTSGTIRGIAGAGRRDSAALADLSSYPLYGAVKSRKQTGFMAKDSVRFRFSMAAWLKTKTRSNAGALIAEVNLRTLFKDVAKEYAKPFVARFDSAVVFKTKWNDSFPAGVDTIRGTAGTFMRVFAVSAAATVPVQKKPGLDTVIPTPVQTQSQDAQRLIARNDSLLKATSSTVVSHDTVKPSDRATGSGSMIPVLLILAIAAVLGVIAVRVIGRHIKVSGRVTDTECDNRVPSGDAAPVAGEEPHFDQKPAGRPLYAKVPPLSRQTPAVGDEVAIISDDDRDEITAGVSAGVRQAVIEELRREIRLDVEQGESAVLREQTRKEIVDELRVSIRRDELAGLTQEIRAELEGVVRAELKTEVARTVGENERGVMEKRARDELRKEVGVRLQREVMPAIEEEARAELKRLLEARVRLECEKSLKEQCLAELEERVRQVVNTTQTDAITNQVRVEIAARIRQRLELEEGKQLEIQERTTLAQDVARHVRETEYDAIFERQRTALQEEVRRKILAEDMPVVTDAEREGIAAQVRQTLMNEHHDEICRTEREILRQDLRGQIVRDESSALRAEETARVREAIGHELESSRPDILNGIRTALEIGCREELLRDCGEEIRSTAYEALVCDARIRLAQTDKAGIISEARALCAKETLQEMPATQIDAIRDQVYESVVEEERQKIILRELPQISRSLREELTRAELESLRERVMEEIRAKEILRIRNQVHAEVVSEAKQDIEQSLRKEFDERTRADAERMAREVTHRLEREFSARALDGYHAVFTQIEETRKMLGDAAALYSLKKTLGLLEEEKSRYKYFNLNMAQTESMMEYMRRLSVNIEDYFKTLDGQLEETIGKMNEAVNRFKEGQ